MKMYILLFDTDKINFDRKKGFWIYFGQLFCTIDYEMCNQFPLQFSVDSFQNLVYILGT